MKHMIEIAPGVFREAPTDTREHMPFKGHRTQKQVREDEESRYICRGLGRKGRRKGKVRG